MIRYAGLWSVGLLCALCAVWILNPQHEHAAPASLQRVSPLPHAPQNTTADRDQILALYQKWQRRHSGPVATYLALYTPGARIYGLFGETPGEMSVAYGLDVLRVTAQGTRDIHQLDHVADLEPPNLIFKRDSVELFADLRYADSGDAYCCRGNCRLLWRKDNGVWRIAEQGAPRGYRLDPDSWTLATPLPHSRTHESKSLTL